MSTLVNTLDPPCSLAREYIRGIFTLPTVFTPALGTFRSDYDYEYDF